MSVDFTRYVVKKHVLQDVCIQEALFVTVEEYGYCE